MSILSVHSQTFNKTYGTANSEQGRKGIRTSEGGYAILQNSGASFNIIKTDSAGIVQWQNNYSSYTTAGMNDMIQTADGGYAVVGQTQTSTYTSGKYSVGLVVKFSSTGVYQWHTVLAGNSSENGGVGNIIQNSNSEYLVSIIYQGHPDFGGSNYHPSITKISSSGAVVWSHAINNSGGVAYQVIADGLNYYVAGKINGVYGYQNYGGNAFLAKYNDAGTQVWLKNYAYAPVVNGNSDGYTSVCKIPTGDFILTGGTTSSGVRRTLLTKLDLNGNKTWDKFYGDTISFNNITSLTDVNVAVTGYSTLNANTLVVYKFNSTDGSKIWSTYYGGANSDYGNSIVELPYNNLLICGTTASFGAGSDDAWLLKLNSQGSLCTQPSQASTPSGNSNLCINSANTTYTTVGASNASSYIWNISPLNAGVITGSTTSASVQWNSSFTGTASITVKGSNGTGCEGVYSNPLIVTVNSNPTASISSQGPTTFCNGDNIVLTATSGSGYTYEWYNNTVFIPNAVNANYSVTQSGNYTVKVINGSCSSTSLPTNVVVNPLPTAIITASGPTTFCQGGFVILTASGGNSYQWNSGSTNSSINVFSSGTSSVIVTLNGCSKTISENIVVNPNPNVSFGTLNNFTNINATPINLIGSPVGGTFSGPGVSGNIFTPSSLGNKTINYTYTNSSNCSNSYSLSTIVYDTTGTVCTSYDTITTHITVTDTLLINVAFAGLTPPNNSNTIKVYPNPANDFVIIDNGNFAMMSGYSVKITNSLGATVFNSPINQAVFNVSTTTFGARGVYYIHILNSNNAIIDTREIVLQ